MQEETNFKSLSEEEVNNLFASSEENEELSQKETEETQKENKEITEINEEELFSQESESVGNEDTDREKNTVVPKDNTSSPNFYSSIADALKNDGVLSIEDIDSIQSAEDFTGAINQEIQNRLDEQLKRVLTALNAGVEPDTIRLYENTILFLKNIDSASLENEDEKSEELRKNLIYLDYINKNFSLERAMKELKRIIDSGTDVEYAKEALEENLKFYKSKYQGLLDASKEKVNKEQEALAKQLERLKKDILENSTVFGDLEINKTTRQLVYDNISKPVWKDPLTGKVYTAIQKYEYDNKEAFLKNLSLVFTLTDGFKNLDKLVEGKVVKKTNQHVRALEEKLNHTQRDTLGNINFASGLGDTDTYFNGLKIDI